MQRSGTLRLPATANAYALGLMLAALVGGPAYAADGPPGITTPTAFPPFNATAAACSVPADLKPVLAYVQENDRDFLEGVDHGLAMAAADRRLEYRRYLIENDSARAVQQIQALQAEHVGALVATSPDPQMLQKPLQDYIWSGGYVGTIVPPPATLLLNAPQYATGKALTDAAVAYIHDVLHDRANVVLLTQDSMQYLTPRFVAMRDGLKDLPGVSIVADIAPQPVDKQGGFDTMNTILSAGLRVDVVLGGDAVVLGALEALRAAGKDRPDQFLGGIDGEIDAVAEIKKPGSPYKASVSLSSPMFGYAMGVYAADWLEGKSIPQAMDILPIALTLDNMASYEADLLDPAAAFKDPVRRDAYLRMYGNICYDSRDQYVNFPWSSEFGK